MDTVRQYGLAGATVLGLLFLLVVVVSLVGGIVWWTRIITTRIKQHRARVRFTREARELAVKRTLAKQRRLVGPEPEPLPEDAAHVAAGVAELEAYLEQHAARSDGGDR